MQKVGEQGENLEVVVSNVQTSYSCFRKGRTTCLEGSLLNVFESNLILNASQALWLLMEFLFFAVLGKDDLLGWKAFLFVS